MYALYWYFFLLRQWTISSYDKIANLDLGKKIIKFSLIDICRPSRWKNDISNSSAICTVVFLNILSLEKKERTNPQLYLWSIVSSYKRIGCWYIYMMENIYITSVWYRKERKSQSQADAKLVLQSESITYIQ